VFDNCGHAMQRIKVEQLLGGRRVDFNGKLGDKGEVDNSGDLFALLSL